MIIIVNDHHCNHHGHDHHCNHYGDDQHCDHHGDSHHFNHHGDDGSLGEEDHGQPSPVCARPWEEKICRVRPLRLLRSDDGHPWWVEPSGLTSTSLVSMRSLISLVSLISIKSRFNDHRCVVQVLLAHCVYLINVVGQMFFTDAFLGYEFSK